MNDQLSLCVPCCHHCKYMLLNLILEKERYYIVFWCLLFNLSENTSTFPSREPGKEQEHIWTNWKPCKEAWGHSCSVGISMGSPSRRECCSYPWWVTTKIVSVYMLWLRVWLCLHQFLGTFTGTTKIKNLDQNLGALAVKLSEEDLREISAAVPIDDVAGARYLTGVDHYSYKFANTPPKDSKVWTWTTQLHLQ